MKKQKNVTLLLLLIFSIGAMAQNRSIKFDHGTFQEAKDRAAKEHKLIFMDCYTSWCGPCKWMAKNMFTNDTIADYYNEHFVCAKFDMEVGEGKDLAKKYMINVYPNLIFADAEGNMVHRRAGAQQHVQDYIAFAKDAQTPEKTYSAIVKKFDSGTRDAAFMVNYLDATAEAGLDSKAGAKAYFATQKESDLNSRANWTIMYKYLSDMNSREFKYLLANTNTFVQKYTEDSVGQKISMVYEDTLMRIIRDKKADKKKYLELKEHIKQSGFKNSEKLLLGTDLSYYQSQGDWTNYTKTAEPLINKYYQKNVFVINDICWTIYEKVTDKQLLAKAVEWAKISMELNDPAFMDTYANLLLKSGNKQEAIKTEEKVVEFLKKNPDPSFPVDEAEATLATFKK